jgi:hypothetical protein
VIFLYVHALINEASTYLKLQEYWVKYVPMLISHGTTVDGNVVYIATKLIKGFELGMDKFHIKLASSVDLIALFQVASSVQGSKCIGCTVCKTSDPRSGDNIL